MTTVRPVGSMRSVLLRMTIDITHLAACARPRQSHFAQCVSCGGVCRGWLLTNRVKLL